MEREELGVLLKKIFPGEHVFRVMWQPGKYHSYH